MAIVRIIDESGVEREVETSSTEFGIVIDGQVRSPALTDEVEIENSGDTSRVQDQCGRTERRRNGSQGWNLTVSGVVTSNNTRNGNLSLQLMKDFVANANSVEIVSDLHSGNIVVSNTVLTQSSDLHSIQTNATNGPERAYDFQLQLGEESSE